MNKNNAKDYLPLVQALADGKVIQHHTGFKDARFWVDCNDDIAFAGSPGRYRIKPEPREWWVVEINKLGESGLGCVGRYTFADEKEAARFATDTGGELIHVREVLPQ